MPTTATPRASATRTVATIATAGLVLTGCSGSDTPEAAAPSSPGSPTPSVTAASCPKPSSTTDPQWPREIPADLPKPANAVLQESTTSPDGVHIVKFTTPSSLREAVLFVVRQLPKAGFVLGRGDAEATEADAPFVRNNIRGLVRMAYVQECSTQWLIATVDTDSGRPTSPLLPTRSPSASSSPLPFG